MKEFLSVRPTIVYTKLRLTIYWGYVMLVSAAEGGGARVRPPFGQTTAHVIPPLIAPPTKTAQGIPPQAKIDSLHQFCFFLRLLVFKNEILT